MAKKYFTSQKVQSKTLWLYTFAWPNRNELLFQNKTIPVIEPEIKSSSEIFVKSEKYVLIERRLWCDRGYLARDSSMLIDTTQNVVFFVRSYYMYHATHGPINVSSSYYWYTHIYTFRNIWYINALVEFCDALQAENVDGEILKCRKFSVLPNIYIMLRVHRSWLQYTKFIASPRNQRDWLHIVRNYPITLNIFQSNCSEIQKIPEFRSLCSKNMTFISTGAYDIQKIFVI